jgi:hypothetical protein
VTELQLASIKADLPRYLRERNALISPEFCAVVAQTNDFISVVIRDGFEAAIAQLPNVAEELCDRPFIEVCAVIAGHHLRFVEAKLERDVIRKSLFEAYFHAAGPGNVFKPPLETGFVRTLRRSGSRNFAAMLFSLHVFNMVCIAIEDEVRERSTDISAFESYMFGVETICRDAVKVAIDANESEVNERWANNVAKSVEARLYFKRTKPQPSSLLSGNQK